MSAEESTEARATRDALVGDLAHHLSVLVRKDLELAAVQRAPEIRQLAIEVAAALAAAVALFLTLGALSWAAFQGLDVAFELALDGSADRRGRVDGDLAARC